MKFYKVLLVEDDQDDAFLLIRNLEKSILNEYSVRVLPSLSDIKFNIIDFKPDIIVLDLGLPGSEGLETLKETMEANSLNKPIVVCSEIFSDLFSQQAIKMGAADYLPKRDLNESSLSRALNFAMIRGK